VNGAGDVSKALAATRRESRLGASCSGATDELRNGFALDRGSPPHLPVEFRIET